MRRPRPAPPLDPAAVERSPFRALLDLPVPAAPGMELPDARAHAQWVQALVDAGFDAFGVDDEGHVIYDQQRVGRLERGAELLHPVVRSHHPADPSAWGAGEQRRIERRLQAWGRDLVETLLAPLRALHAEPLGAAARGLLYQLEQGLGTITCAEARSQLEGLTTEERQRLRAAGVELGQAVVHVPAMLSAKALRWRAALLRAWLARPVPVLSPAAVSVPADANVPPEDYLRLGRVVLAGRAVRADQLERTHAALQASGPEPFALPPELGAWLGCRRSQLPALLRAMGYRPADAERWVRARGRGHRRRRRHAS